MSSTWLRHRPFPQVQNRPAIVLSLEGGASRLKQRLIHLQPPSLPSDQGSQSSSPNGYTTSLPDRGHLANIRLTSPWPLRFYLCSSWSHTQTFVSTHVLYLWSCGGNLVNDMQRLYQEACIPEWAVLSAAFLEIADITKCPSCQWLKGNLLFPPSVMSG